MNNKMLALYGLKWNPFAPSVPTEALHLTTRLESFCWRVQQLAVSVSWTPHGLPGACMLDSPYGHRRDPDCFGGIR